MPKISILPSTPITEKPVRHIIPISGKDSLCTAIVQMTRNENLPYEFVFCDTQMELPETYIWLNNVEKKMGVSIKRVGRSLEDVIAMNEGLPSQQRRFCTRESKIEPMNKLIGKDETILYMGIRADEKDRVPASGIPWINYNFPLAEMNIDLPTVYSILNSRNLMPPTFYWKTLYDLVLQALSTDELAFVEQLKPWEFNSLFSWRSRSNCFMCFYQRQYEWVGLLEMHPDLYVRAERLEQDFGGITGDGSAMRNYNFHQDYSLAWIRSNAERILKERAIKLIKTIRNMNRRVDEGLDMLSMVSCGLYCGK